MIDIQLKNIAERLGKNIADIARETGLNRNTITDLYHNKVDGIKFSTIDALCDAYGINLQDLVARREFRIGGTSTTKLVQEIRFDSPFFLWSYLNALRSPSSQYFDVGIGNVYAFFVRERVELYFDRNDASRCAHRIYERYGRDGLHEIHATFMRMRDQVMANIDGLSKQPLEQYVGIDLIKAFQRLSDLNADMLAMSAWIDAFNFDVRDEIVNQIQKAHGFTQAETSLLLASGEMTSSVMRRLALLELAKTNKPSILEQKDTKQFLQTYPFVTTNELIETVRTYTSHPALLAEEYDLLTHLPRRHAQAVKSVLQTCKMRINPLAFFSQLAHLRDERDEVALHVRFQMERLLRVLTERFRISSDFAPYLLPQELLNAQSGLVNDRTLKYRHEEGLLIAMEHGEYKIHEGEHAVSMQDDLITRYVSQLTYEDVS